MMDNNSVQVNASPSQDVMDKVALSAMEVKNMTLRDVRCPYCNFVVAKVYSDMSGHIYVRCRKCKREQALSLTYFRKQKDIWQLKLKYYGNDYFEKLNIK